MYWLPDSDYKRFAEAQESPEAEPQLSLDTYLEELEEKERLNKGNNNNNDNNNDNEHISRGPFRVKHAQLL